MTTPKRAASRRAARIPVQEASLLEIAYTNTGGSLRRAAQAITHLIEWGLWTESNDPRAPDRKINDFAEWAAHGQSTARRHSLTFREAFPGHATPDVLWTRLRTAIDREAPRATWVTQIGAMRVAL